VGELQMDWLRSEDLKEEKDVIAPAAIVADTSDQKLNRIWLELIETRAGGRERFDKTIP
jgi:hypothetical protein